MAPLWQLRALESGNSEGFGSERLLKIIFCSNIEFLLRTELVEEVLLDQRSSLMSLELFLHRFNWINSVLLTLSRLGNKFPQLSVPDPNTLRH